MRACNAAEQHHYKLSGKVNRGEYCSRWRWCAFSHHVSSFEFWLITVDLGFIPTADQIAKVFAPRILPFQNAGSIRPSCYVYALLQLFGHPHWRKYVEAWVVGHYRIKRTSTEAKSRCDFFRRSFFVGENKISGFSHTFINRSCLRLPWPLDVHQKFQHPLLPFPPNCTAVRRVLASSVCHAYKLMWISPSSVFYTKKRRTALIERKLKAVRTRLCLAKLAHREKRVICSCWL